MDLGPVQRITTDAIGEPGQRVFYLQTRAGAELVTVIVEKEQVQLLSTSILELLATLDIETGSGPDESEMALEEPIEARWRVGRLALGFDQALRMFTLEMEELRPEQEPEDEDTVPDEPAEVVRLMATTEQMFAVSVHGAAVAARGRPTCPYCHNPMDPEGHACPAMNGHSRR